MPRPAKQKDHTQQKVHARHIHIIANHLLATKVLCPAVARLTSQTVKPTWVAYVRQIGNHKDTTQPGDHGELWGRLQITF